MFQVWRLSRNPMWCPFSTKSSPLSPIPNTIQSLVLLKCMATKQTMSLGGTRDIKLLPDYSSGVNHFLQLRQVVVGRKNLSC
jgi:hypothetical protein